MMLRRGGRADAIARFLFVAVVAASVAGCFREEARRPVPAGLIENARIPGYDAIRAWGDEPQGFDEALRRKDRQVRDAGVSGKAPDGLVKADFLAISGGGDQGAFAAGFMKGWSAKGDRPVFEAVTGVSAGALAAPFVFLGPSHDSELEEIFTRFSMGNLVESRGIFGYFGNSLNDNTPLADLIRRRATDAFLDGIAAQYRLGRRIFIQTTNLDAQRPVIWDLSAIAASRRPDRRELFTNVLLASSAIPGVFPPVLFRVLGDDGRVYDEMHADGGVTAQLLFVPPDLKLIKIEDEIFQKRRLRSLYILRNGKLMPQYQPVPETVMAIAKRGVQTLVKYQVVADLQRLKKIASMNNTRFFFDATPADFETMDKAFDDTYAKHLFATGVERGKLGAWSSDPPETPVLAEP